MNDRSYANVSILLNAWSEGEESALEELMPLVYEELRVMAKRYMNGQPSGHTLQTTALIHEAYLKLVDNKEKRWENRAHFFAVAASAMRHILVDYARSRNAQKRGGPLGNLTLNDELLGPVNHSDEIVALDEALNRLASLDERKGQVVEMKFFGGLKVEEIAEVLTISPETVNRDWRFARNWLLRELAA